MFKNLGSKGPGSRRNSQNTGLLQHATITLTDAQIKALPTTPVTLVPAPGAGFRIKAIAGSLMLDSGGGAYTNIDTTYAAFAFCNPNASSFWFMQGPINDSTILVSPLADFSDFFGATHTPVYEMVQLLTAIQQATSGDHLWVLGETAWPGWTDVDNKAVLIAMDNNGTGDLTGGNALNRMKVHIQYVIEAMP